jgi:hypothetical protein
VEGSQAWVLDQVQDKVGGMFLAAASAVRWGNIPKFRDEG